MIHVDNRKTIQKMARNTFRANKMRNIFAVLAIVLTTILFTTLFTTASSLITSIEESYMRQVGGSAHAGLKRLTEEQYNRLSTHKSIKEISYTVVLAAAENEELSKRGAEIRFAKDELAAEMMFALPTTGRMPQADDEIATDTLVLGYLGVPAEIGQEVTLEYWVGEEYYVDTFTLVGFWEGDIISPASQVWLNRGFVEQRLANYEPMGEWDFVGAINADFNFNSSSFLEGKIIKLIEDSGYTMDEIDYGVNWAYMGGSDAVNLGTVAGVLCIVLMVMFCGYLIISNVFAISITKDIQYYGLLKTIGTTAKQICSLIRRQAVWLCLIGVPLGIGAGYLISMKVTPMVLATLTVNTIAVSLHPLMLLATAFFAVLTVFVSVAKPSKIAAKVSPIEALRVSDGQQSSKKTTKKSGGVSIWRMAVSNMMRNQKKLSLVVLSLSLSLIILNATYSLVNSFDKEAYLANMISNDYVIGDVSYFNLYGSSLEKGTVEEELITMLETAAGVESCNHIYFDERPVELDERLKTLPDEVEKTLNAGSDWVENMRVEVGQGMIMQHIYGLDWEVWNRMKVQDGKLDREKLASGNYVVVCPYDTEGKVLYYRIGDKVQLTAADGSVKEYEVLAIASIPYNISVRHIHPMGPDFFLTSEVFRSDIADKGPMLTTLDVTDDSKAETEALLSDYCSRVNPKLQYVSRESYAAEYESSQRAYKIVGTVLSILLALIGIMNFSNTIITSIFSRKRELAMLQSIGMTGRQVNRLLVDEGLLYTLLTVVFTLTLGSGIGYLAVNVLIGGDYLSMHFTVLPSLLCIPFLVLISGVIPYVSHKIVSKKSVVERLRECE